MRIDHVALWSREIDALCEFYESYFGGNAGPKYENRARGFKSRFVTFADGGVLELMSRSDVALSFRSVAFRHGVMWSPPLAM